MNLTLPSVRQKSGKAKSKKKPFLQLSSSDSDPCCFSARGLREFVARELAKIYYVLQVWLVLALGGFFRQLRLWVGSCRGLPAVHDRQFRLAKVATTPLYPLERQATQAVLR